MINTGSNKVTLLASIICLAAAIYISFTQLSVYNDYIKHISRNNILWQQASTIKFAEHWLKDGFVNDRGLMLEFPKSIDRPTLAERDIYVSYLPGVSLEVFLLKKLFPSADLLRLSQYFAMLNQFLTALVLAIIVLKAFPKNRLPFHHLFVTLSFLTYIVWHATLFLNANCFFADLAVLLPFALVLLLELLLRESIQYRKRYLILQALVLGWAAFIDWLIIPLGCVLLFFRLVTPIQTSSFGKRLFVNCIQIFSGLVCAIIVLLIQIISFGQWSTLVNRFLFRVGFKDTLNETYFQFIQLNLSISFFLILMFVFCYLCYYLKTKKQHQTIALIGLIAILTCFFHLLLLKNHSVRHAFSIMKFAIPIALVMFGIIPQLLTDNFIELENKGKLAPGNFYIVAPWFLLFWYICIFAPSLADKYLPLGKEFTHVKIVNWLGSHATFYDVYIGKGFSILGKPPEIELSKKEVRSFTSLIAMKTFVHQLPRAAHLNAILPKEDAVKCQGLEQTIVTEIYSEKKPWVILKLKPENFETFGKCLLTKENLFLKSYNYVIDAGATK